MIRFIDAYPKWVAIFAIVIFLGCAPPLKEQALWDRCEGALRIFSMDLEVLSISSFEGPRGRQAYFEGLSQSGDTLTVFGAKCIRADMRECAEVGKTIHTTLDWWASKYLPSRGDFESMCPSFVLDDKQAFNSQSHCIKL